MPEIIESNGDIFASGCEALVNPVDTTGAQGAGLAKEFRRRYPRECKMYREVCDMGKMRPGDVWAWTIDDGTRLWFTATKNKYWNPSRIDYIEKALASLVQLTAVKRPKSIGIPALGSGYGRLGYADVRPLILAAAERMTCDRVVVFAPKEARKK